MAIEGSASWWVLATDAVAAGPWHVSQVSTGFPLGSVHVWSAAWPVAAAVSWQVMHAAVDGAVQEVFAQRPETHDWPTPQASELAHEVPPSAWQTVQFRRSTGSSRSVKSTSWFRKPR
jgi:hypothetical protein